MNRGRTFYDVCWSPKDTSKFLTVNFEEIRLYDVITLSPDGKVVPGASRLSESTAAKLIWKTSDIKGIRCIDWFTKPEFKGTLLAVGCENGEVVLSGYGTDEHSIRGMTLNAKPSTHQVRPCNDVRWSTKDLKLACAFERTRGEPAVQVFDLEAMRKDDADNPKPLVSFGHQDAAQSVCFTPENSNYPSALVCGTTARKIRVFDVREPSTTTVSGNTNAIFGLTFDPYNVDRLASYGSDSICIWDLRNLNAPMIQIRDQNNISKLRWCPNRSNQLTAIQYDCNQLSLYIVRDMYLSRDMSTDAYDHTVIRQLQPRGSLNLRSFSWHHEAENRMLIYDGGDEITDYTIIDQITLNWSPVSEIIWTHGKKIVHRLHEADALYKVIDPLSTRVRQRAKSGFGCVKNATNICLDATLVDDDPPLLNLHCWLKQLESAENTGPRDLTGVYYLLENISESTSHAGKLALDNSPNNVKYLSYYDHAARRKVMALLQAIDHRGEEDWAQKAVAALFQLDMRKVMEYLEMPSKNDQDLNSALVALAISGYSEQKGSTWREMCATLKPHIRNPYLAAIFAFLMSTSDDYNQVLNTPIAIQDKIMFACRFLSDLKLQRFIKEQTAEYVRAGKIEGILLTGLHTTSENKINTHLLDLLQNYVDRTADVQAASAIAVVTRNPHIIGHERTQRWIECYRGLLNQWRLWTERALFDCAMAPTMDRTVPPQIRVHCNYCRKPISAPNETRGRHAFRPAPPVQRITSCPSCRKPLPRCAMCLTNMGTPISRPNRDLKETRDADALLHQTETSQFGRWFTWCQSCMHGGHTQHMAHWFEKHEKCPVTGCQCKCASIDVSNSQMLEFDKRTV